MSSSPYYKSILFTIMLLFLASCASKKSTVADKNIKTRNDIVDFGKKYLNTPYKYAATGPSSFDCSGYTSFVFSKFGFKLDQSSAGQARQAVTIRRKEELEVGDLVFFEGRSHNGRVGHVGIVSEKGRKDQFKFIHASTSNGVIITSSNEAYYKARYLRGGRVLKETAKKPKVEKKEESTIVSNNYEKSQNQVTYKETADGFVAIHAANGQSLDESTTVSAEQTSKPVKNKKSEDKKKKKASEVRQQAIRVSEESPILPPNRITHKVKMGETLFSISQTHNCSVEQLKKWNPEIVNNVIQAGDELDIYQ